MDGIVAAGGALGRGKVPIPVLSGTLIPSGPRTPLDAKAICARTCGNIPASEPVADTLSQYQLPVEGRGGS